MLTTDLLWARRWRGEIRPHYIDSEAQEHRNLAAEMIALYADHVGCTRQELQQELAELLGSGTAFLFHRGLAKLLLDRCTFSTQSPVPPEQLRAEIFAAAAAGYRQLALGTTALAREPVLAPTASRLGLTHGDLERYLYADLDQEQILEAFAPCSPHWLLRRYNVALAQGILLRATALTVRVRGETPARYRELFRRIKFCQLLHQVAGNADEGYEIVLDGPLSLFQSSQKYGLSMASFLPTLLHFADWSLSAAVRWGRSRQTTRFELSPAQGLKPYGRLTGQWQPAELSFLPAQFALLGSEWQISTDGELIELGGQGVLIPDFVFVHPGGVRVVMEVLGFWRRGSVNSRLRLLRQHGPPNLLLAVSKALAADQDLDLPGEVYVFRAHPIARQVLAALERLRGRS